MHEHILKAVLSQGGPALGRFVRWWLLVVAVLSTGMGAIIIGSDQHGDIGAVLLGALVGLIAFSPIVAVPAAVAVAIAFVAIKF